MRLLHRILLSLSLTIVAAIYSGCGSSSSTKLRALQASPNETTTMNVLLDGATLFSGLSLGTPTSYSTVTSGSRTLVVEPTGSSTAAINETISLPSGTHNTLITANYAANLTPILLTDDTTSPSSGNFKLRVVNAAVEAGTVDVYIQAPGATDPSNGSVTPTASSLGLTSSSPYQSLAAGSWNIIVTPAGYPVVKYINSGTLSFSSGQNRTLVILPDGSGGISFVMLSDLN